LGSLGHCPLHASIGILHAPAQEGILHQLGWLYDSNCEQLIALATMIVVCFEHLATRHSAILREGHATKKLKG
jgi:hypothetical protein